MAYYLKFDLFEKTVLDTFPDISQEQKASCSHYGRDYIWIGDLEGIVYRYNRDYSSTMFFAYEKCVNMVYQCKERDILITCGIDSGASDIIKIWNLSKWSNQNVPSIVRSINHGPNSENDFKVTCLDVMKNLNAMVVGLSNGVIELFYNDILTVKRSKRIELHTMSAGEKLTSVSLVQETGSSVYFVYATTINRVVVLIFDEITAQIKVSVDDSEIGCPTKCSVYADTTFFVTNNRGIYEVTSEGMGRCRALDGNKIALAVFRNYLVVVKLVTTSILAGTHLTKNQRTNAGASSASNYQVVMFDRINKIIAGEFTVTDFNFLFVEWNSIYVYCGYPTSKMVCLTEKDIQNKLKIFIQKNSFNVAISAAKTLCFNTESISEMYKQYGDHLYGQKNYEEAVNAYIETIGYLEPSFVIGKFLDSSNLLHLSKFLEALVTKDKWTGEHLVLLFNCYIILKDRVKLQKLIQSHQPTADFDIDSIMNLMRKVNLFDESLMLAQHYKKHTWYMRVLIEDLKQYNRAIDYMTQQMPLQETEDCLLRYGDVLINVEPEVIAQQLERVCDQQSDSKLSITTILNVFANNRKGLKHFLARYIEKTQNTRECHIIYINTYLELLLYEYDKEKTNGSNKKIEEKIMNIITNPDIQYSNSKVLMSCYERGFRPGYRYLCEKQGKFLEILNSFKLENDIRAMINTCFKFGDTNTELWVLLLEYLVDINAEDKYFDEVIHEIESRKLMSPLLLLQKMTAGKNKLHFGLVKEYIMRYYENNESVINKYKDEIDQLKDETRKNDDIIKCLNTDVQVFQNLKCSTCTNNLDIPSVHFLCGHSYHMRCFERYRNQNNECIKCSPNIESLLAEINQWQSSDQKLTSLTNTPHSLQQSSNCNQKPIKMEKLWNTLLRQPLHPITVDERNNPDLSLADQLVQAVVIGEKEEKYKEDILRQNNAKAARNVTTETTKARNSSLNQNSQNPAQKQNPFDGYDSSSSPVTKNASNSKLTQNPSAFNNKRNNSDNSLSSNSRYTSKVGAMAIPSSPFDIPPAKSSTQKVQSKTMTPTNESPSNKVAVATPSNPFDLPPGKSNAQKVLTKSASPTSTSPINKPGIATDAQSNPFGEFMDDASPDVKQHNDWENDVKYPKNKNPFE